MFARRALVAAVVLLLCGCVAVPPAVDSAAATEAQRIHMLDLTWQRLGLQGVHERPTPALRALAPDEDWGMAVAECMNAAGHPAVAFGAGNDSGYELADAGGDDEALFDFYTCVASMPLDPFFAAAYKSPEQLDYIYDYYASTLVPCLVVNGLRPVEVPTRDEFQAMAGRWSPYSAAEQLDSTHYHELVRDCGAETPPLD